MSSSQFNVHCTACPRLAKALAEVRANEKFKDYHARPVPAFGEDGSRFLIVGLAPGMHGANRSGRPFTGDFAGIILYHALHRFGFSNLAEVSDLGDGLVLTGCRITNAVKCWPPQNKPLGAEVNTCNGYLKEELATLPDQSIVLALGGVSHRAIIKALGLRQVDYKFGHNAWHTLPNGLTLVDSYHTSRYNIQTKRLTQPMFDGVIEQINTWCNERN